MRMSNGFEENSRMEFDLKFDGIACLIHSPSIIFLPRCHSRHDVRMRLWSYQPQKLNGKRSSKRSSFWTHKFPCFVMATLGLNIAIISAETRCGRHATLMIWDTRGADMHWHHTLASFQGVAILRISWALSWGPTGSNFWKNVEVGEPTKFLTKSSNFHENSVKRKLSISEYVMFMYFSIQTHMYKCPSILDGRNCVSNSWLMKSGNMTLWMLRSRCKGMPLGINAAFQRNKFIKTVMHFEVIINRQSSKSYPVVAVQEEYDAEKLCIQLVVIGRRVKTRSVGFGQVPRVLSNAINFLGLQSHHITFCLTWSHGVHLDLLWKESGSSHQCFMKVAANTLIPNRQQAVYACMHDMLCILWHGLRNTSVSKYCGNRWK